MNRAGMTLVEVTIALTLVAASVTGGYQLYRTAGSLSDRVDASLTELASEVAMRATISAWFRHPVVGAGEAAFYGHDQTWLGIADDRLELWVRNPFPSVSELSRLELFVDRDDATPEEGLVASIASPPDWTERRLVLAPTVERLNLSFRTPHVSGGQELSSWQSRSLTPRSIRIELGAAPGEHLPPLLSRPWVIAVGGAR